MTCVRESRHARKARAVGADPARLAQAAIEAAARAAGVTSSDLVGRSHAQRFVRPRHRAMWALRKTGMSWKSIGRFFGRDHTSVLAAVDRMDWFFDHVPAERTTLGLITQILADGGAYAMTQSDNGEIIINGKTYMSDARGALAPLETVRPEHKLEDETVRKIMGYARELSAQITRFKQHVFDDLGSFEALLAQEYGSAKGGAKGNKTFMSFDGRMKVQVQVADHIDFGPQLQIAKALIDECLTEWSADSRPEIRAIVTRAFNTDKAGQINRSEIFMLLRLDIDDARWKRAMDAIRDAMRVVGSKTYIRCYERESAEAPWRAVTIDLAKA